MKTRKSFVRMASGSALALLLIHGNGCTSTPPRDLTPDDRYTFELKSEKVEPKRVEGGKYPAVKRDLKARLNESQEDKPYYVSRGPERGKLSPQNPEYDVRQLKPKDPAGSGDSQAPLVFEDYDETDDATPSAHLSLPEPSVAKNGQTVMTTGNFWMSLSEDGGQTFNSVNPTTIFPEDYGGFCCDQVLQYVPRHDLFVWLLQYQLSNGVNAIRIAVQDTQGVRDSNGTAWTYWDFVNTTFATGMLDYNDMSFGDNFLYWTSSVGGGANRYVIRVPLSELKARSTVNFQFTGSTDAFWSHVTQNGTNGVYWAGHVDNSTLKVYSMMDADGFYSWREVPINSWPNNTMSSITPDGATDWLQDASWKTYVRAAAVKGNSAYFAWNASDGGGFPRTHVQIVQISTSTFTLQNQMQIWNPDFAFAYPYFEMNAEGQLGMIVAFGGPPLESSSGVGVWGDFVIYYPRLSGSSRANYGHYHTARRAGPKATEWVGAGYIRETDGTIVPYYIRFSR